MDRRIFIVIVLLSLLFSCGNKKKSVEPTPVEVDSVDTIRFAEEDTVFFMIEPEEPPLPAAGDESFEDFIYVFASDTSFQRTRIIFPLPYYEGETPRKIEQEEWKHDHLFVQQSYYTLLLDNEDELDHAVDNSQTSVQVEWIFMETHMVKKYYFERTEGRWMLEAINERPVVKKKREDFIKFFVRFATDSLYQVQHVREPLEFITTDPDDDFSIIETTLDIDQWFAFKPVLPNKKLSNIIYGQEQPDDSSYKIIQLKGIGNGFLNTLFFRRKSSGKWELYKFEDTSN